MKYLTLEGLKKVKDELLERKTIKRQEIAKRLEEAKALGDLSENAEYAATKDDQAFNEGKILELETLMKEATVIDLSKRQSTGQQTVQIGSVIEVKQENRKNEKKEFTIVSSQEAQPDIGKISNESPLGTAFLDHRKDDIIEVETPGGKIKYKIMMIK